MIDVNLQTYVYALYTLISFTIVGVILVVRSLQSDDYPIASIKLFNIYFVLGVFGWIGLGIKDITDIEISLMISVVFYIVCSFALFLAVMECIRKKRLAFFFGLLSIVFIVFNFFLDSDQSRLILLPIYAFTVYPFILFMSVKRARDNKNIGNAIIGFAAFEVLCMAAYQLYCILVNADFALAYNSNFIASALGFELVAIGFVSTVLINEHNLLLSLSLKDSLTGLLNRRGMDYSLNLSLQVAQRSHQCISAIAIDIDHFKNINDTYGHDGGDQVLRELGIVLEKYTRTTDVCCRLGGEEFVIIQPDTSSEVSMVVAERIRQHIEKLEIQYNNEIISLTSSLGVATHCIRLNIDTILKDADKALYKAKDNGRNQVYLAIV